jgi:hypothetical protein
MHTHPDAFPRTYNTACANWDLLRMNDSKGLGIRPIKEAENKNGIGLQSRLTRLVRSGTCQVDTPKNLAMEVVF